MVKEENQAKRLILKPFQAAIDFLMHISGLIKSSNMKLSRKVKFGYHLVKLMFNPDKNIKSLIYVSDQLAINKASQNAVNELFKSKKLQHMYEQKKGLEQLDLQVLKTYDKNSLGYEVFQFYKEKGLDVYPMKNMENISREIYISERVRKIHDILHVCLDFDTDLMGEAKVNAFVSCQAKMPVSVLIVCGIIIKFIFSKPFQFQMLLKEIIEGWRIGGETKNFLIQDWDELLKVQSSTVKNHLNINKEPNYRLIRNM